MRYPRGSISISAGQDIPLLRQVLESQFITHDQLFEFMRLGCHELKRHSFNWRVRRLVQSGFLDLCSRRHCLIYSIASAGASLLEVTEDYCLVLRKRHERQRDARAFNHSLELNELHLSLLRQGVLERWQPEIAVRSANELTPHGYAKDYDAIVTINVEDKTASFALEYERTPKKPSDYSRIRTLIEGENRLDLFIYVVPNRDLASFILDCFAGTTAALFVAYASDFTRPFTEMKVIEARSGIKTPLLAVL
jgi:hypothetical protein